MTDTEETEERGRLVKVDTWVCAATSWPCGVKQADRTKASRAFVSETWQKITDTEPHNNKSSNCLRGERGGSTAVTVIGTKVY